MTSQKKASICPYCSISMRTVAMKCDACGVEIHADFADSIFHRLDTDDLMFLEQYLMADFSIKALAESSGLGYTAIRNRLDRIIQNGRHLQTDEMEKRKILDKLAKGEISAAKAADLIRKIS